MRHKMYQRFKAEFEALPEYATGGADKIRFLLDKWAELEAENKRLWSEQHEGQRVYRRLLAELEDQRGINEGQSMRLAELREASKTTALEIYRHSAMGGSEEGFLSYWDSAVESRMQLLQETDNE